MKTTILFLITMTLAIVLNAQSNNDSLVIEQAARNYVEGWQTGNTDRVLKAVSPELAKRVVMHDESGNYFISDMSASLLAYATIKNKEGVRMPDQTPDDPFKLSVKILDITGNIASVKAWNTKYGFMDYCHLARFGNDWKIVNVLWDYLPKN